jgi:hypothetical protein
MLSEKKILNITKNYWEGRVVECKHSFLDRSSVRFSKILISDSLLVVCVEYEDDVLMEDKIFIVSELPDFINKWVLQYFNTTIVIKIISLPSHMAQTPQ